MTLSFDVGVLVTARLGFMAKWRYSGGPRVLDLRLLAPAEEVEATMNELGYQVGDWVIIPASRVADLPQHVDQPVFWRSPHCTRDDLDSALNARWGSVFVTHASQLEGIAPERVLFSGFEVAGVGGEESTLVLLRRILEKTRAPVYVVGGLGPDAAAGAVTAGAAGVIVSETLWATPEAGAEEGMLALLERFDPSDSAGLGRHFDFELRVYRQLATKPPKAYEAYELAQSDDAAGAAACWDEMLTQLPEGAVPSVFNPRYQLVPVGQVSALASQLRDQFGRADAILDHYKHVIGTAWHGVRADYPLTEGAGVSERFGVRFPLFQGPMSQVCDGAGFVDKIERSGAFPWVAFSNMPDYIAEPLRADVHEVMGDRPWGVGIIGMDSNRYRDAHLELLYKSPPPWVMVAAGTLEQAMNFQNRGVNTVFHTPVPAMFRTALEAGIKHFILEGSEAGGHVGKLGTVVLTQYVTQMLLEEASKGRDLSELSIVVAGGFSDRSSAHFAAGMLYRLHDLGVAVGIQMGTAYLLTHEAVDSGALSPVFQEMALTSEGTRLLGRSVNTPTRVLCSVAAENVLSNEDGRLRDGVPLKTRKEHYEDDNFGGLRAAAKAQTVEFTDETRKHTRLAAITPDVQRETGLFHAGQTVALLKKARPALELNIEMTTPIETKHTKVSRTTGKTPFTGVLPTGEVRRAGSVPSEEAQGEPIAIIGVGAKVPGALDATTFWKNIRDGVCSIGEVPSDVWDPELYWDDDRSTPDKTYSKIGGFVRDFHFDRKAFRIPPKVVQSIDPTQRLALAATADALEDAGLHDAEFDRERCAVILGNALGGDQREKTSLRVHYPKVAKAIRESAAAAGLSSEAAERLIVEAEQQFKGDLPPITEDSMPGELANVVAGRISNAFDLRGPSYITDAACASSLAALDASVRSLRDGVCDIAVTGGSDRSMSPAVYTKFCKIGALSAERSCPFDARADGFVMGEGAVILVLKRLADAVEAGDRVYAVIRSVGGASDGKGKGITAPNPAGQVRALRAAYAEAGVEPRTIGMLEAHGTSTRVGDVVEVNSFSALFEDEQADQPIALGSVKSNIGHLKAAAGAAGVFKAALALHYKTLPPTCNVETLNPNINFDAAPLRVQREAQPWAAGAYPRRAGVSSFGFGGTNFHVVLEEYHADSTKRVNAPGGGGHHKAPPIERAPSPASRPEGRPAPLRAVNSAPKVDAIGIQSDSREGLTSALRTLVSTLDSGGEEAYEAYRLPFEADKRHRLAIAAPDATQAVALARKALKALEAGKNFRILENQGVILRDSHEERDGKLAFLFTGQGSQYLGMGDDLRDDYIEIEQAFAESDELLAGHFEKPLSQYVFGHEDDDRAAFTALSQTEITQPAVLTLDAALFRILGRYGLKPDVVAGHSLGEYGACFAAGIMTVAEAIRTVAVRGTAMASAQPLEGDKGVMASVSLLASEVEPHLAQFGGRVVIANKNSPDQTIIAGYTAETERAIAYFEELGVRTMRLPVSHAFHTEIVSPASEPLRGFLDTLQIRAPHTPIYTNVTAEKYPEATTEIRDLLSVQLARPVEWHEIVERMYAEGVRTFVEVGPKRALAGFVSATLGDRTHRSYVSNHPKFGGRASLARLIGSLWAEGQLPNHLPLSLEDEDIEYDMDIVITGAAIGLPGTDEVFAPDAIRTLLEGNNLISEIPHAVRERIADKGIQRVEKTSDGRARIVEVNGPDETIQLAGQAGEFDLTSWGYPGDYESALDRASQLALAAAIETLKDARLPLVRKIKKTKSGKELATGWTLPASMADDTGIIFCSLFAGTESAIEGTNGGDDGAFDRQYLRRIMALGHGAVASWIGARGPNVLINTACASTTSGLALAQDWLRLGRARRVLVIGADDVTEADGLLEWVGSGFLSVGAASVEREVENAALPFDRRRQGLILGMGAVGILVEPAEDAAARGLEPVAALLGADIANSAGHPTRLDADHLGEVMSRTVHAAAAKLGMTPAEMAEQTVFFSHETYTPARGGSASGEVAALRATFGDDHTNVLIANTKGLTGHPMGATIEEAAAVKALQFGVVPPVANHREVDEELGNLNLSAGGAHDRRFALRLAAGFGSQVGITLYDRRATGEERVQNRDAFERWVNATAGHAKALAVVDRTLVARDANGVGLSDSIALFETQRAQLAPAAGNGSPVIDKVPVAPAEPAEAEAPKLPGMLSWASKVLTTPTADVAAEPASGRRTEAAEPAVVQQVSEPAAVQRSTDDAYTVLLATLCEKTGYDADEIEPDFELEADLGVDTVKQAEIMASVREHFELERDEEFRLADFPTLQDLAGYITSRMGASAPVSAPVGAGLAPARDDAPTAAPDPSAPASEPASAPVGAGLAPVRDSAPIAVTDDVDVAFAPTAVVPNAVTPIPVDLVALKARFSGRTVALYDVDRCHRLALTAALDSLGAKTFPLGGETEAELAKALETADASGRIALIIGSGAGLADPAQVGGRVFRVLRALEQVIGTAHISDVPVLGLTRCGGTLGLDGGGGASPGIASGMLKAIAREWDSSLVRLIDLGDETADEHYAMALLTQAFLGDAVECGFTWGNRIELVEAPIESDRPLHLASDDVLLITGGARGVTAVVAKTIAQRFGCRLALMGRTAVDGLGDLNAIDLDAEKRRIKSELAESNERVTPAMVRNALKPYVRAIEVRDTLAAIKAAGGDAAYFACDVTNRRSVAESVAEIRRRFGPIDGVIHGAGVEFSKMLADKSDHEVSLTIATKVAGASNLLWALRVDPLRTFMTFGSVVGRFGNAGQVDYAGANDALSKMMCRLSHQRSEIAACNVAWTGWNDVGMAVDGGTARFMEERGIELLPAELGAQRCAELLESGARGEVLIAEGLGDLREAPGAAHAAQRGADLEPIEPAEVGPDLLEAVELAEDGLSATAGVLLEAEEPYLNDHRIDGTPVLPGVFGVELGAQLCRRLAGGKPFRGVDDMHFDKPAKLHRDEPLQMVVEASRDEVRPDGTVLFAVKLRSVRQGRTGRDIETEHFAGRFRFGGPGDGPRSPLHLDPAGQVYEGFGRDTIYDHYFHTGTFALLDEVVAVGDQLAVGEGRISGDRLSDLCDSMITDPLVTELAFQTGGLQGLALNSLMLLPRRIARSTKLQNAPAGERLTTRVAIREFSNDHLVFDAEVLTDDGQVLSRYEGIDLIAVGPVETRGIERSPIQMIVGRLEADDLPTTTFDHPERLAAPGEIEAYERKKGDKARRDWVVSRTLVKQHVGDFYRRFYGAGLRPNEITIEKDELGAPSITVSRELGARDQAPQMSLSHSTGKAILSLVPPWRKAIAGIDLEKIEARSERFLEDYFTDAEQAIVNSANGKRDSLATTIWSLKEAASKSLGMGTHLDFRNEIEVTDLANDTANIRFDGRALEQLNKLGVAFSRANYKIEDGYAAAAVELAGANAGPSHTELASVMALLLHCGHC